MICPYCENELDAKHAKDGCRTRFTRRFLFGLFGGAAAASAMAYADVWDEPYRCVHLGAAERVVINLHAGDKIISDRQFTSVAARGAATDSPAIYERTVDIFATRAFNASLFGPWDFKIYRPKQPWWRRREG